MTHDIREIGPRNRRRWQRRPRSEFPATTVRIVKVLQAAASIGKESYLTAEVRKDFRQPFAPFLL